MQTLNKTDKVFPYKTPLRLLIIQTTSFCNIDCSYCYLPDKKNRNRLDVNIIPSLVNNLIDCNLLRDELPELPVIWHAGEPLSVPPSFYEEAFHLFEKYNTTTCELKHAFQTNATLITDKYCEVIKKYNVHVGVSIDGPQFIHDKYRKTRQGKGTFEIVMKGIQLLKKHEIPFSIISVLTSDSLNYAKEIYDFFMSLNPVRVAFNIDELEGANHHSSYQEKGIEKKHIEFLSDFYDLCYSDNKLFLREFIKIKEGLIHGKEAIYNSQAEPLGIISVDTSGNYSTFSPELLGDSNYIFGNVINDAFTNIYQNNHFSKVYEEVAKGVKQCQESCEYFNLCGGGAPVNKLYENKTFNSSETLHCKHTKKLVANVVLDKLEKEIRQLEESSKLDEFTTI